MRENEGPSVIPVVSGHLHCGLCKYHERQMVKSGRDPIVEHYCKHPASVQPAPDSPMLMLLPGDPGAYIGKGDITPAWCPFLTGEAD